MLPAMRWSLRSSPSPRPFVLASLCVALVPAGCGDDATATDDASSSSSSSSTGGATVADSSSGTTQADSSGSSSSAGETGSGDSSSSGVADSSSGGSDSSSSAGVTTAESSSSDTGMVALECPVAVLGPALPALAFGNTIGVQDDGSGSCGGSGAPEVGYHFTAPADGLYTFDTQGSQLDSVLYVLDGDCAGTELACSDDGDGHQSAVTVSLTSGQLVTVVVDGHGTAEGPFNLRVRAGGFTCPLDDLGNAVPNTISGDNTSLYDGFASSCGGQAGRDAPYLFTAPNDGSFTFDTFGSSFESTIAVYDGPCGVNQLSCGDQGALVTLAQGQQVTVVVDTQFQTGAFDLHVAGLGGVCPDQDVGNAVPQTVAGDTSGHDNTDAGSCGGAFSGDDLYEFTAPADGLYAFDTFGSALDTVLYVRDGGCGGVEFDCNDDFAPGNPQSRVVMGLSAGQTVMIGVDGNGTGSYQLNISEVPCPNEPYPGTLPGSVAGSTVGGIDKVRGSCATDPVTFETPDYVYGFTAPEDGEYTFTTFNSNMDTVLYILDGAACNGDEIACSDDFQFNWTSALSLHLDAGQAVSVVVDGKFENEGDFVLDIGQLGGGLCPDTDLGNTIPVATSGNTSVGDNTVAGTCGGLTQNDDIYFFTAPMDGLYNFNTVGSVNDTVLIIRDGDCTGPELGCSDNTGFVSTDSNVAITLAQDQTVMVAVDGAFGDGAYNLNIDFVTCPDESIGSDVPASYDGATLGEADKLESPDCPDDGSPDYVFEFTAPADGSYTFDLQGSDYDTVLFVQDAACGGSELACNDDFFGLQSSVSVNLTQDQTVMVVVSGFQGNSGNFTLNIN